jgi:hypothetical protein
MDESVEQRPLIDRETFHALQQRHDQPSFIMRLTPQLGVYLRGGGYTRTERSGYE